MRFISILAFLLIQTWGLLGQKNITNFIFGHSLINHEFQVNPTPSQETSVPHWFHDLAIASGHNYTVSGQYGFLTQHVNLPPIAQWGFDNVPGAWDSDNEPFTDADFSHILITPANFAQWQAPNINYFNENTSPVQATVDIFEWCLAQEPDIKLFIYENWPDMAPYLSADFPPNDQEWDAYNAYTNGDFHQWFLEYHDLVLENMPNNACVKMIPVGPAISTVLNQAPFNQIPVTDLYEDDAPHGRPNIYFIAALVSYMAMYEEKPSSNYPIQNIIHPILSDNYQLCVDIIWDYLQSFNFSNGESRVFCNNPILSQTEISTNQSSFRVFPNPAKAIINIESKLNKFDGPLSFEIFNSFGQVIQNGQLNNNVTSITLGQTRSQFAYILIRDKNGKVIYQEKIIM